jgi:hypothetical protein
METLLTPIGDRVQEEGSSQLFLSFINRLEGFKTRCKNLHWAAPRKNIHVYLDDFLGVISDYQDGLAEGYMGILGKMQPNAVKGIPCDCLNAFDFIATVKATTIDFYSKIPEDVIYKGITSECETFIQNINKYDYLFHLCDVRLY